MRPSLNYDSKDPKFILLSKIFKIIGSKKVLDIYSRNGVKNRKMMDLTIKVSFLSMFFDYPISEVIDELNRSSKLRKFCGFSDEIPTVSQIYEYFTRYSSTQYCNIVNSMLNKYNKRGRGEIKRFIADATPCACDFNKDKRFITKEHLKKLKLKWGYSTTKGHFIGFKVTVVLDEKRLTPVSILIHSGAPSDTKIFDDVLKELKRRRIIKDGDIIFLDRGYYSYKNYQIGINKYHIVPVIFPKSSFKIEKLLGQISYPLDVFKKNKDTKRSKNIIKSLTRKLCHMLKNWKDFKPIRGQIEDFFKVAKNTFGLGQFHSYTPKSMSRNIYLCLLLTTLVIQQGYTSKTKMQRLSEGDITQEKPVIKKTKKDKEKSETSDDTTTPHKTEQQKLVPVLKEKQSTLEFFAEI